MKELLFSVSKKDFKVETMRGSGKGGQHRNKTDSAVRIIHKDSGAVGYAEDERSQHQNKITAFKRLLATPKWKVWYNTRIWEAMRKETIGDRVEKLMSPANIKIEVKDEEGRWVEEE